MKRTIISIIITLSASMIVLAGIPVRINQLAGQYKGQEGFEVVSVGQLGLSLLKGAALLSGDLDEQDRAALKLFDGIRKLVILDFEDASPSAKVHIAGQVEKVLTGMELVMEMHDSEETVRIYGVEDGPLIKDCIIFSSDGALICIDGGIDMDHIGTLIGNQK